MRDRHAVIVLAGEVLGGAERGAIDFANGLVSRRGARVTICALDAADLAVFGSYGELMPHAVTEPMTLGLPVVAFDVPGVREAVGEPGRELLAPLGDVGALADAIVRVGLDAAVREHIGVANARVARARLADEVTSDAFVGLLSSELRRR